MPKPKQIDKRILKAVYKDRPRQVHKGDYGRVLIIGGSERYTGTPTLNSQAAINSLASYRTGVDLVTVIAPKRAVEVAAKFSPDLITIPLDGKELNKKHLDILLGEADKHDAFVIGGGVGRKKITLETIRGFLKKVGKPGVIDADGIHALENSGIDLSKFVLTPHSHEFSILTGEKPSQQVYTRTLEVQKEAEALNTTILLKGHKDIVSNGEETAINKSGTPYMTVGGTGDTLAGITSSLIAQGNSNLLSAAAASYINGKAGENTGRKRSLIASDLLEEIAKIVDSV